MAAVPCRAHHRLLTHLRDAVSEVTAFVIEEHKPKLKAVVASRRVKPPAGGVMAYLSKCVRRQVRAVRAVLSLSQNDVCFARLPWSDSFVKT
jgi:hypothetical protein